MSDANYLRTGRGGAGNFYSQKDVEDAATKDKTEDIEAQKPTAPLDANGTAPNTVSPANTGVYARSGRGGAGNFVPSSNLPNTTTSPPPSSSPYTSTPTSTSNGQSSGASKYAGRGGAGNWGDGESEGVKLAKDEQDRRRKEALDAGIAQEIRANLPHPPRTYHLHEPGRGRRPEDDLVDT
ncbi:hypothetical protein E0Z10_g1035 [Xylaria hypoxylon]|uniref:Uncharacterized protein n=1 Tax=Xylaria hypoxylon TaxID=37992 RepID=A0A4Z0YTL8_9PEZI|nr:hypothetical protein E0Z10_g1035 [Xylaria hypoxylon]